jgi:FG-GAP-like repeat/IPT/TIG domain
LYDPETRLRLKKSSIDSKRLKLSFWTGRDVQRQYAANLRNPVACVNLLAAILGGCGNAKMAANPVSVTLDPSTTQIIQQGQNLKISATVGNDSSGKGVSWSLNGSGSLASQTATSVTYHAPGSLSNLEKAMVTAMSLADPTQSKSLQITVRPLAAAVPFINLPLVPPSASPGGPGFVMTVNGTGFASGATVEFNGNALTTTFVSDHQLTAVVPTGDIATAGTASIVVANSGTAHLTSNVVFFPVATPEASVTFSNAAGSPISLGINPVVVAVADFNGDGKQDLAVTHQFNQGSIDMLLGNGDGTFTPAPGSPIPIGKAAGYILVGDFNGDGKPDLAVTEETINPAAIAIIEVFLGNGDGTFVRAPSPTSFVNDLNPVIAVGDFNGDGKLDLAVGHHFSNSLSILLGNGDGTFAQPFDTPVPADASGGSAIATGDFNGDGILDLAMTTGRDNATTILLGNGDGTFAPAPGSPITVGNFPGFLVAADLNGDGKLDLAVPNFISGNVTILLGNGDGTFTEAMGSPIQVGNEPVNMAVGGFNADGKVDLVVQGQSSADSIVILLGNGDGTFTRPPPTTVPQAGPVAAADFNGDGRLDLAVVDNYDKQLFILLQP